MKSLPALVLMATLWQGNSNDQSTDGSKVAEPPERYRCAIDLYDHKRGTARVVSLNDIFRLLDLRLRHEIHEKAVMHRVVQAANAMLSRALLLLGDKRLTPVELVRLGEEDYALQGEDSFFQRLFERCAGLVGDKEKDLKTRRRIIEARRILRKLIDRCVYRPLMIIPGDRAADHFQFWGWPKDDPRKTEYDLRTLATIIDSAHYSPLLLFVSACVEKYLQGIFATDRELWEYASSVVADNAAPELINQAMNVVPSRVIIWTTPYKQLYKDPAVVVALGSWVDPIDEFEKKYPQASTQNESVRDLVKASIKDADSKYAALWKLYVFISDGLFYTGILNKLKERLFRVGTPEDAVKQHQSRLKKAEALFTAAFGAVHRNWDDFCRPLNSVEDQQERLKLKEEYLKEPMNLERFRSLVKRWISGSRR